MRESEMAEDPLIQFNDSKNDLGGSGGATGGGGGGGGGGMNIPPVGFNYPNHTAGEKSPFDYPQNLQSSKMEEFDLSSFVPSILLTNPQSLTNCFDSFVERVKEKDPDVVAVSETWFSGNRPASEFEMDGYTLFHDDREDRRGGGVALYIRTRLVPYSTAIDVPSILECIWAGVGSSLYICALYHAPRSPTGKLLLEHLVNTVLDIRSSSRNQVKVIVIGDMNELPHERLFSTLKLQNLVKEPTHKNSVIDLILTDAPHLFGEPQLLPPIGNSEHHCVFIKPALQNCYPDAFNLPNVPPSQSYGTQPLDMSVDNMSNNLKSVVNAKYGMDSSGASTGQWDALMGLENSPPPPYSSAVHPPASAPPQSLPPTSFGAVGQRQDRPVFPPDVSAQGGRNLKDIITSSGFSTFQNKLDKYLNDLTIIKLICINFIYNSCCERTSLIFYKRFNRFKGDCIFTLGISFDQCDTLKHCKSG
ncbi:hypothetical protein Avbf_04667 [Armadillidium vulgare]|nr:hypothetical protein Avbf_04667 [Armadillidium vulgare]